MTYRRTTTAFAALFLASMLLGCAEKTLVHSVREVDAEIREDYPTGLSITAKGTASSHGWTEPELVMRDDTVPDDGVYEFDFVAQKPGDAAAQALRKIKATKVIAPVPLNLQGVRVHAKTNSAVYMIEGPPPPPPADVD